MHRSGIRYTAFVSTLLQQVSIFTASCHAEELLMSVQEKIQSKLQENLFPQMLAIENESHMHSGPATESHFKVIAVAKEFEALSLVKRHQRVYALLKEELTGGVHALSLHLYTPAEWEARNAQAPSSPDCRGGSRAGRGSQ
jgi:BolA protein